jgi:hypothetical protein
MDYGADGPTWQFLEDALLLVDGRWSSDIGAIYFQLQDATFVGKFGIS